MNNEVEEEHKDKNEPSIEVDTTDMKDNRMEDASRKREISLTPPKNIDPRKRNDK